MNVELLNAIATEKATHNDPLFQTMKTLKNRHRKYLKETGIKVPLKEWIMFQSEKDMIGLIGKAKRIYFRGVK